MSENFRDCRGERLKRFQLFFRLLSPCFLPNSNTCDGVMKRKKKGLVFDEGLGDVYEDKPAH